MTNTLIIMNDLGIHHTHLKNKINYLMLSDIKFCVSSQFHLIKHQSALKYYFFL